MLGTASESEKSYFRPVPTSPVGRKSRKNNMNNEKYTVNVALGKPPSPSQGLAVRVSCARQSDPALRLETSYHSIMLLDALGNQ